ncbi:MAG: NUDIX domain-containing protein, partial [Bacteriovoracaceae bacterium]|nr:NUDIX domain-containing protein [Bacteriovoracaceae bacterium]
MSKLPLSVLAILKHGDEIFFINRQDHLRVFPGYCSFPGGKVDRKESELDHFGLPPKLLGALARELMEELRFDIVHEIKNENILSIRQIGQAITPDFNPYRFEAHYLLIEVSEKPKFTLCSNEIKNAFWMQPKQLRLKYECGELIVIPPMWNVLDYLENSREGIESFNLITPDSEVPCLESIYGVKQFMPLSNTLPPAERTNAFFIGDILVDPSPKDASELDKLMNSIPKDKVKNIFITHHHGDHHNLSTKVAKELGASILLSRYTYERIVEVSGKEHFVDVDITFCQERDVVTNWLGKKVIVHEIPGHDEGHLGLAPESLEWFIAGDLYQGVGTVVIGGRE